MSTKKHEHHGGAGEAQGAESKQSENLATASPATESGNGSGGEVSESPAAVEDQLRGKIAELESQIAILGEEASSLKNQYLRSLADAENFRKRMFRERDEAEKYKNVGLLSDLVPLLDDFDRAIASAEHAREYQTLHDGIAIIRRQMGSILENKYGLTRYESVNLPFDPNVHEAVASEPGEVEEPLVSLEFLPGYKLHDRVVRSAKVRVRMPTPRAAPTAGASASQAPERGDVADETSAKSS